MSYILDALKKSEQERSRGAVPDIQTVHQPGAVVSHRSSSRPVVFLIVLVVIIAGLGYWIFGKNQFPWGGKFQEFQDDKNISSSPSSESNLAQGAVSNSVVKNSDEIATAETLSQVELAQRLTTLQENAEQDNAEQDKAEHKDSIQQTQKTAAVQKKPSATNAGTQKGEKVAHTKPKTSRPNVVFSEEPLTATNGAWQGNSQLDKSQQSTQSDSSGAEDTDVIYDIAELPEDIKRNLPSISFAGHVYSSNKSQRSVMLNGKKMREGEEVAKGLMLDKITMDGVVFRSQGYRFKLGALQDWSFQ